jgi:antitoxin (DNA-binding transcriptional repressor) of toxin-antitoxin stability system
VVIQGATVIVARNGRVIARITPEAPRMTASVALAGLGLFPKEADAWIEDSRGNFDEPMRDPWA